MNCKPSKSGKETLKKEGVDEELYLKYYRKSEYNTPDPFIVAKILQFKGEGTDLKVKVGLFYQSENTGLQASVDDMTLLYGSQDTDWYLWTVKRVDATSGVVMRTTGGQQLV